MVSGRNERRRFKLADTAQQIVGGVLFAGSFVVTEEVWALARNMSSVQSALIVGIVAAVGYASLYKADPNRDPDRKRDIGGIPLRFLSLMGVILRRGGGARADARRTGDLSLGSARRRVGARHDTSGEHRGDLQRDRRSDCRQRVLNASILKSGVSSSTVIPRCHLDSRPAAAAVSATHRAPSPRR